MEPEVNGTPSKKESTQDDGKVMEKGHPLSLTCLCIDSQDQHVFTGSKDGSIVKWSMITGKPLIKLKSVPASEKKDRKKRHHRHINCIAISSDDKFLATGGWDKEIRIWSPETLDWIHTFSGHRKEITALAFRVDHLVLYSGSADHSLSLWTLEEEDNRAYIESLYGHESPVTSIDTLRKERILSTGGRDQSVRIWKIVEQAQTVFQSSHESADIARYIDDKTFVSSGEDGAITIWSAMKRKPILSLENVHKPSSSTNGLGCGPRFDGKISSCWVTALATFRLKEKEISKKTTKKRRLNNNKTVSKCTQEEKLNGESSADDDEGMNETGTEKDLALIASGSCNFEIYVWKLVKIDGKHQMLPHQTIPCPGFVNDLKFTSDGRKLIAACGQEHKLGRWWKLKGVKNTMRMYDIKEVR